MELVSKKRHLLSVSRVEVTKQAPVSIRVTDKLQHKQQQQTSRAIHVDSCMNSSLDCDGFAVVSLLLSCCVVVDFTFVLRLIYSHCRHRSAKRKETLLPRNRLRDAILSVFVSSLFLLC